MFCSPLLGAVSPKFILKPSPQAPDVTVMGPCHGPSVLVTQTVNGCLLSSRESGNGDDTGKTVSGQRELVLDHGERWRGQEGLSTNTQGGEGAAQKIEWSPVWVLPSLDVPGEQRSRGCARPGPRPASPRCVLSLQPQSQRLPDPAPLSMAA